MSTETKEMLGEYLMLDEWAENLRYGLRPSQSEGHRLSDVMVAMSVLCTELQDEISERGGDGRQVVISRTQFGAGYWLTAEWYREKAKALEPLCGAGLVVGPLWGLYRLLGFMAQELAAKPQLFTITVRGVASPSAEPGTEVLS